MDRSNSLGPWLALVAVALLVGAPALGNETKVRAHLERARALQGSGGSDVARWLRELHSARGALAEVQEEKRAELQGEIEGVLAAGMERHLSKARELLGTPGGARRAEIYYLQPAERALKDFSDDATQARYGVVFAELRRGGAEAESEAAAERERQRAAAAAERTRRTAERERLAAEREPAAAASAAPPGRAPAAGSERAREPGHSSAQAPASAEGAPAEPPSELSGGEVVLVVLAYLGVLALLLIGGGWLARLALRRFQDRDPLEAIPVGFGGFGALIVVIGLSVAVSEDAWGGAFTIAFGAVFVGLGLLTRKLLPSPEDTREVVVSRSAAEVVTYEGRLAQRAQEVRIQVDADASEEEVAAAQRQWKRSLWQQRQDWVRGSLEEDGAHYGGLVFWGAGLWTLVSVALLCGFWFSDEAAIGLSAAGTGMMALTFAAMAARLELHKRKFGPSRLELLETPLFLGEGLRGLLHTGVAREHAPAGGFRLSLRCVLSYEESSNQERGDVRRRAVLWSHEASASGLDSAENPGRLDLDVDLQLPSDQDETSTVGRDGIVWELAVHADLPGLDYRTTFELPVFRRDEDAWVAASPLGPSTGHEPPAGEARTRA